MGLCFTRQKAKRGWLTNCHRDFIIQTVQLMNYYKDRKSQPPLCTMLLDCIHLLHLEVNTRCATPEKGSRYAGTHCIYDLIYTIFCIQALLLWPLVSRLPRLKERPPSRDCFLNENVWYIICWWELDLF